MEQHQALADLFEPFCSQGRKHSLIKNLGGWIRQRGLAPADLAAVVRELGSRGALNDPEARLRAGLAAWQIPAAFGFHELVSAGLPQQLLDAVPSPRWDAELESRRKAAAELEQLLTTPGALEIAQTQSIDCWGDFRVMGDGDVKPLRTLVEGLDIVPGFTTALIGKASNAKTPVALSMALALANGTPWLGKQCEKCNVVYFTYEKPIACSRKRKRIARAVGLQATSVHLIDARDVMLTDHQSTLRVAKLSHALLSTGKPLVVFVDTYGSSVVGVDHNSNAYSEPLKGLSSTLTAMGAAFVPLMHCKKSAIVPTREDIEGHTSVIGALDAAMGLYRPDDADQFVFELTSVRPIEDGFSPFCLRWDNTPEPTDSPLADPKWGLAVSLSESGFHQEKKLNRDDSEALARQRIRAMMLSQLSDPLARMQQRDVVEAVNMRRSIVIAALKAMCEDGELLLEKRGDARSYRLPGKR